MKIYPRGGSFTPGGVYYAAVFPSTISAGLTITYGYQTKDETSHTVQIRDCTKSSSNELTLSAGTTVLIPAVDMSTVTAVAHEGIQLWDGGPYFSTMNVGATSITNPGSGLPWSEDWDDWGPSWTIGASGSMELDPETLEEYPVGELAELFLAARGESSKVTLEHTSVSSTYGFLFTGSNGATMFIPSYEGDKDYGRIKFWTCTKDQYDSAWRLELVYESWEDYVFYGTNLIPCGYDEDQPVTIRPVYRE